MTAKKTPRSGPAHAPRLRTSSSVRRGQGGPAVGGAAARPRPVSSVPPPGADNSGVRPLPESYPPPADGLQSGGSLEEAVQIALDGDVGGEASELGARIELPPTDVVSSDSPLKTALLQAAEGPGAVPSPEPRRPRRERRTPRAFPAVDLEQARRSTPPPPRPEPTTAARSPRTRSERVNAPLPLIDRTTPIPGVRAERHLANTPRAYPGRGSAASRPSVGPTAPSGRIAVLVVVASLAFAAVYGLRSMAAPAGEHVGHGEPSATQR